MEEKSLRVYSDKKFFTKLTNTITKLLIPTKIGINGMLIEGRVRFDAFVLTSKVDAIYVHATGAVS